MKVIKTVGNDYVGENRFSRRFAGEVEILERETIRTIKRKDIAGTNCQVTMAPRLVIGDALSATKLFIAKARSEHRDLDNFLRKIVGPQRQAK